MKNWVGCEHFKKLGPVLLMLFSGIILFLLAHPITNFFSDNILPSSMTVASRGTFYDSFAGRQGFTYQLKWLGGSLIMVALLLECLTSNRVSSIIMQIPGLLERNRVPILCILLFFTFFLYWYLSYPLYAYPSNSNYHWVRNLEEEKWLGIYPIVKLVHNSFYDYPRLVMGINGGLNALLVFLIAMKLFSSVLVAFSLLLCFILSGNMLQFANIAEAVHINIFLILLALYAYLSRLPYVSGIVFFLVSLGRRQYSLIIFAFIVAELIRGVRLTESGGWARAAKSLKTKFVCTNALTFGIGIAIWNGYTVLRGINPFFLKTDVEGRISRGSLLNILQHYDDMSVVYDSIEYPFSGAYFFHILWVFPIIFVGGILVAPLLWKNLNQQARGLYIFAVIFILLNLAVHEAFPGYYNIRYLSYLYPLVLFAGAIAILGMKPASMRIRLLLCFLLILSSATTYNPAFALRTKLEKKPLTDLFLFTDYLRNLNRGRIVYTDSSNRYERNCLSYLFKVQPEAVEYISDPLKAKQPGLFVSVKKKRGKCIEPIVETRAASVCRVRAASTAKE